MEPLGYCDILSLKHAVYKGTHCQIPLQNITYRFNGEDERKGCSYIQSQVDD
jgi:hypothetical protein